MARRNELESVKAIRPMVEFKCEDCGTEICHVTASRVPEPALCIECQVIREAEPGDRATFRKIFRKPCEAEA